MNMILNVGKGCVQLSVCEMINALKVKHGMVELKVVAYTRLSRNCFHVTVQSELGGEKLKDVQGMQCVQGSRPFGN